MTNRDKRRARHHAYLMLYQWDISSLSPEEISSLYWEEVEETSPQVKELAKRLFRSTVESLENVDTEIEKHLKEGWKVLRLLPVDRSILRGATYEILNWNLSPAEAVINDAVEFAKLYGEDPKSPAFINAVLDKVKRDVGK
ncbi:NusB antitermination factor [Thermovibrio guaymasensis]|uniref:Transcription antitermination protein NusB n=1 Tax=Thermovibrio guaymasensis TaxID=240167 RepID=A0A420W918_9BACT|nr:transcription antitermination factor NusB [Thermovibrio guaymasensis]RKQ63765.1 NusB antitermination factor [Thermovibrio guaymasensis]